MKDRLYLIDGHALVFKMYYAFLRRPMINSKGADMSILFGFTKYILELINREHPEYLAVAFDPPGGTFRNVMYPEYKATRAATPQLVIDALEPLTGICRSLKIPVLMVPGFEADDVIGSMAKREAASGKQVYMVTPDKDYGQLIEENIFQVKPGKSGGADEIVDVKAVCGKYGIDNPAQVIEMLTLCGDTADNVPGVKGVGEVGAGKLIAKYGTVENIYRHIDELTARQQTQFREAEGHIALSHDLVTIKTDMELAVNDDDMKVTASYTPEVADLFEEYEFNSLKRLLPDAAGAERPSVEAKKMKINEVNASVLAGKAADLHRVAIVQAAEGTGVFAEVTGMALAVCSDEEATNLEVNVAYGSPAEFSKLLSDTCIDKYGYELKTMAGQLGNMGIELGGKLMDISLMHYLINPEKSHKSEILAKSYIGIDIENNAEESEEQDAPLSLFDAPAEDDGKGCVTEAAAAMLTGLKVKEDMATNSVSGLYDEIEEPLMHVLEKMELAGVKVDLAQLGEFAEELRKEMNEREARIRDMAEMPELNISSPRQIGELLFDKLKLDPKAKKTARGSYTTDEATLTALSDKHPIIEEILEFRAVKKLLSTYIEPFPMFVNKQTGRVHTTFNQALTATGRLSSSNPNLQNIPIRTERGKEIRKAFVAGSADGLIVSADYSQIELRIMAHLSQDQHLIQAFRNGVDVHAATAEKIFGVPHEEVTADQRRVAKTANFGIMYGISSFGLSQRLGISRSEAKKLIDDYFNAFPAIRSFIDDTIAAARENGYVETIFGRRRYLPDINAKNATVRALAERNAVNAPIQGTAADIIKLAMIGVDRKMAEEGLKSKMVLQIHDELLFDTISSEREKLMSIVKEQMEHVTELSVPLTVECNYGKNWLEAH